MELQALVDGNKATELEAAKRDAKNMLEKATHLAREIKDQSSLQLAVNYKFSLQDFRKAYLKSRDAEKKALKAAKDAFDESVNTVVEPIKRAEEILEDPIEDFMRKEIQRKEKEEARIHAERLQQEEADRIAMAAEMEKIGDKVAAQEILSTPMPVAPTILPKQEIEGGGFAMIVDYEIVNEKLAPREVLKLDDAKVNSFAKLNCPEKGELVLPWIRVFKMPNLKRARGVA